MSITQETITHVGKLARLQLDSKLHGEALLQINQLLANFQQLSQIDVSHVEPLFHPGDLALQLRADVVTETDQSAAFQAIAPEVASDLYLVPKVIEG
jgi:aspartyl-tRNA(Asn)/glutamyl-tRNA(Gln) amidotransferase subunit C